MRSFEIKVVFAVLFFAVLFFAFMFGVNFEYIPPASKGKVLTTSGYTGQYRLLALLYCLTLNYLLKK